MAGDKQLGQGKRKCFIKCQDHQFSLHPKNSKCWLKAPTNIDFCPLYNDTLARYENIVPVFNYDEQQCLPGFILEVDRNDYQRSMQKYKEDHQRKIQEYTMKKTKLQIPKPGRKHRYCGVCRKPYVDYLDHIKSTDHICSFTKHDFVNVINKIINDDYRTTEENKIQNDSSTYPSKVVVQKKRGRKPKNPDEPKVTKKKQTQPVINEPSLPYRQSQPPTTAPYFQQQFYFPYAAAINHLGLNNVNMIQQAAYQIPPQLLVSYPFQLSVVDAMRVGDLSKLFSNLDGKCDEKIVN